MNDEKNIIKDPNGFLTIKDKPTLEELKRHYEKLYKEFDGNLKIRKNYQERYDEQEMRHINLLNDLCLYSLEIYNNDWQKNPGKMLEVGVGEGFFLDRAMKKGWDVYGIDFNFNGIEKFNSHLNDLVEAGDAFEILEKRKSNEERYDVCIIQNVLEHVLEPKKLLQNLSKMLNKNGIIVVKIPNDFSRIQLSLKKLGLIKEDFWVVPPEHLNYFNTENFKEFMNSINFEIIDMYSTFPIDFFLFHENSNYIKEPKYGKMVHRARVEIDLLLGESGLENYYNLCKSMANCNVGRSITVLIKPKK